MKCKDCRWWERHNDTATGQCRGEMPKVIDSDTLEGAWPIVHEEDWCSFFDPKILPVDDSEIKVSEK